MNTEEPPKTKIACIEKMRDGLSRSNKPFNLNFTPQNSKRREVKVCRMEWRQKGRQKKGCPPAFDWVVTETLATFEGPTAHLAAEQFIAMLDRGCTAANKTKCVADGLPLSKLQ